MHLLQRHRHLVSEAVDCPHEAGTPHGLRVDPDEVRHHAPATVRLAAEVTKLFTLLTGQLGTPSTGLREPHQLDEQPPLHDLNVLHHGLHLVPRRAVLAVRLVQIEARVRGPGPGRDPETPDWHPRVTRFFVLCFI